MSRATLAILPLRDLREDAGVTLEDMASILSRKLGRSISTQYVRLLEHRGTRVYDYISAYAEATGKHISLVAAVASPKK